jgi:hypothetical protein
MSRPICFRCWATPARGRFFTDAENAPPGADRVAVISDALWRDEFDRADAALGRAIVIGDEPFVVIGVAPRGFTGPQLGRVDAWLPGHVLGARITPDFLTSWNAQWLTVIGRLRPGVTFEQAGDEATILHRRGYTGGDQAEADARFHVAPLSASESGTEAVEMRVLRWLIGVTAAVLIIACANVANLLLARGTRRSRDVAMRSE